MLQEHRRSGRARKAYGLGRGLPRYGVAGWQREPGARANRCVSIAASIVDHQFKQAGIYALTGGVLSFFGFIHRIH